MSSQRVRGNYDQLGQISRKFGAESDRAQDIINQVRRQMEVLRGGDWIGQGANRFYGEMDSQVLPSLGRLTQAMAEAARVTAQIVAILQQAEDEAARILNKEPGQSATLADLMPHDLGEFKNSIVDRAGNLWDTDKQHSWF